MNIDRHIYTLYRQRALKCSIAGHSGVINNSNVDKVTGAHFNTPVGVDTLAVQPLNFNYRFWKWREKNFINVFNSSQEPKKNKIREGGVNYRLSLH